MRPREVVGWWELRRIPYNLAVGLIGIISFLILQLIGQTLVAPGEDFQKPSLLVTVAIVFGFGANACYTLGWIIELKFLGGHSEAHALYRTFFWRAGLLLSCVAATLPIWLGVLFWCAHRLFRFL